MHQRSKIHLRNAGITDQTVECATSCVISYIKHTQHLIDRSINYMSLTSIRSRLTSILVFAGSPFDINQPAIRMVVKVWTDCLRVWSMTDNRWGPPYLNFEVSRNQLEPTNIYFEVIRLTVWHPYRRVRRIVLFETVAKSYDLGLGTKNGYNLSDQCFDCQTVQTKKRL